MEVSFSFVYYWLLGCWQYRYRSAGRQFYFKSFNISPWVKREIYKLKLSLIQWVLRSIIDSLKFIIADWIHLFHLKILFWNVYNIMQCYHIGISNYHNIRSLSGAYEVRGWDFSYVQPRDWDCLAVSRIILLVKILNGFYLINMIMFPCIKEIFNLCGAQL